MSWLSHSRQATLIELLIMVLAILGVAFCVLVAITELSIKASQEKKTIVPVISNKTLSFGGDAPMQTNESAYRFSTTRDNHDLGGQSYLSGGNIIWKSESSFGDGDGTSPETVIQATIDRLSQLQKTAQANDVRPKVLLKLMEALDLLKGESIELSEIHSK